MVDPLRVLFVVPEAVPFVKTGGLADVAGALAEALRHLGVDLRLVLPCYRGIREGGKAFRRHPEPLPGWLGREWGQAGLLETRSPGGVPVYLVERHDLYDRSGLYDEGGRSYHDNLQRFSYFCHAALRLCGLLDYRPHVVHAHDWQAGLALALLKGPYRDDPALRAARGVFTIHNVGYQGRFGGSELPQTGLPFNFFHPGGLEYHGDLSLLKAGIAYAEAITTVSPRYAREIQRAPLGMGMEGSLSYRRQRLHGILNGIDEQTWDPGNDPHLAAPFDSQDLAGKRRCKRALLQELHLDPALLARPLLGITTRLTEQKGVDLLLEAIERLLALDLGLAVLGTGEPRYEQALRAAAAAHPGRLAARIAFDEGLAHRIAAASDIFLVPSRYEPCGLTQMYAMRYGSLPLVRATGGLDDSVRSCLPYDGQGTGFKFQDPSARALGDCVAQAVALYARPERWRRIQRNAMEADFGWTRAARSYLALYEQVRAMPV